MTRNYAVEITVAALDALGRTARDPSIPDDEFRDLAIIALRDLDALPELSEPELSDDGEQIGFVPATTGGAA